MNNNQRYSFHPQPTTTGELRLIVACHGTVTIADAHRLVDDLSAALVNIAQLAQCDAIEIDACVGLDGKGTVTDYMSAGTMERVTVSEYGDQIACWTVYGHHEDGGSIDLFDYHTSADAQAAADVLRLMLPRIRMVAS